jgi:hypothetical protein
MRKSLIALLVTASSLAATATASAQHGGDIGLTVEGGRIVTNLLDGSVYEPARVFGSELGENFPNFTNEPGFDSQHPGPFQAGSAIGVNILDALRKWDGSDFEAIAAETMTVSYQTGPTTTLTRTTPATADTTVGGFGLGVASDGGWHRHLGFSLDAPASDGIYLLKLDLFSDQTSPGLGNSQPFYIVFNQNDEGSHDAAVDYVQANVVPEPAGFGLFGAAAAWLLRRRR